MILQVIKWWREVVLGSSRAFTRELARAWQDAISLRNGHQYWKTPNFNSKKQVRVLVYRECDWRGRKLLFDSKTVRKATTPNKQPRRTCRKEKIVNESFEFLKPSSDEKMLGEMIFGSVAMSYQGITMKIHTIRSPPQLMMSFVFPVPNPRTENQRGFTGSGSLQNSTSEIFIPKYENKHDSPNSSSAAHSVPLDVPFQKEYMNCFPEDRFNDSFQSTTSNSSVTSVMYSPDSQASSLTRSNSYNSFQRRLQRNMNTNIEFGLGRRFDEMQSYYEESKYRRRRVKFGLSVAISFEENADEFSNFQEFFFSHITLIEGHVNKLVDLATEPFSDKQSFLTAFLGGTELFQSALQDLYTSPRLSQPLWLSMVSPTSNHHFHCQKLMSEFLSLIKQFDTKQTHFFLSTLLTSVLTHHLSWVSTVTPTEGTSSHNFQRKEAANWLDSLAKSHPYNPLWMQLGDLYGAVGFPTKISRTIIRGHHSNTVMKILYVLSYFVRCSDVYEKIDEGDVLTDSLKETLFLAEKEITENLHFDEKPTLSSESSRLFFRQNSIPNNCSCNNKLCAKKSSPIKNTTRANEVHFTVGDSPIIAPKTNTNEPKTSLGFNNLNTSDDPTAVRSPDGEVFTELPYCDSLGYGSLNEITSVAHSAASVTDFDRLSEKTLIANSECQEDRSLNNSSVGQLTGNINLGVKVGVDECSSQVNSEVVGLSAEQLVNQAKLYIQEYQNLRFSESDEPIKTEDGCRDGLKCLSKLDTTTETDFREEGYISMEDSKIKTAINEGAKSLGSIMQSMHSSYLPVGTKEINLARVSFKEVDEGESLCNGFGWSLLAGISDHYLSDFCLQGIVGELSEEKLYDDLTSSLKASVLGEPVASAVCIVADTDLWSVKLCSSSFPNESKQKVSVSMSPLVAGICDSLLQMSQLNMSEEFCLMHLEDRLQELYFRSQSLAALLQNEAFTSQDSSLESVAKILGIDMHDLPLLISVASTHTPELSKFNR